MVCISAKETEVRRYVKSLQTLPVIYCWKVLVRIILNRINLHVVGIVVPESQYNFPAGKGTGVLRQLQEKCLEQNRESQIVFMELTMVLIL